MCLCQRRRNVGGDGGARPRNVESTGVRVSYCPRNISHISACCSLNFHSLSLCCLHTIKNFIKQKTHRPILHIRLAYVISKMANFHVCCDKQQ